MVNLQNLPDNFFNPLTGKNRTIYVNILDLIENKSVCSRIQKNDAIEYVSSYLSEKKINYIDIENPEEKNITIADKANRIVNTLTNYNWFEEEIDSNNLKRTISVTTEASELIDYLRNATSGNVQEYTNIIFSINEKVNNQERWKNEPYRNALEPIYNETRKYIKGLKNLEKRCFVQIKEALKNKTAEEIFTNFSEYCNGSLIPEFYRLMKYGSPVQSGIMIRNTLKEKREDKEIFKKLVLNAKDVQDITECEAENQIPELFDNICTMLVEDAENIINSIQDKIGRYIRIISKRLQYLSNRKNTTEQSLAIVVKDIIENSNSLNEPLSDEESSLLDFTKMEYIDLLSVNGFLKKKNSKENVKAQPFLDSSIEKIAQPTPSKYGRINRNKFINKHIDRNKNIVSRNELSINSKEDNLMLLASIPQLVKDEGYQLEVLDEFINEGNYETQNFRLVRKGKE